jgi:hypothetical protein
MTTPYRGHDRGHEEPAREALAVPEPRALGRLRSTHATGATAKRVLAAMTAIAGVLAALAVAWPGAPWLVGGSLLLATAVGAWVGVASILGLDTALEVHQGGIVVRRSWRRPKIIRFDDIVALRITRGFSSLSFLLDRPDGTRVVLPLGVSERARLLATVESEIERPILEDAQRSLSRGEPLTFGPIVLELDGLRHRDELLLWSDLDRVRVSDGGMVFIQKSTQHAFVVLATSDLPFPRVLVALLARRTRVEADDPFWTRFV